MPLPCSAPPKRVCRRGRGLSDIADLPALLQRLRAHRGAASDESLGLDALHPLTALRDCEAAGDLLAHAIVNGQRILIVGDYDADGATGAALGLLGLRALGAATVEHLMPSRFAFGYGLTPGVVDLAHARAPDLLVTVDHGTSSVAAVAHANALGIPVLIADHHMPGDELPAARALVNPNQPGCDFPSKHLAGVGVMFYLLAATRARLRARGWFHPGRAEPNLAMFLDLVALGTLADVVALDANNRILVEQGLRRIRAGHCRPGLRALLEIGGQRLNQVGARDLVFTAAPRLNAAGRLDDMSIGVECLITEDPVRAMLLARQLHAFNGQRRQLEAGIRAAAEALVARTQERAGGLPPALCLYGETWHQGIVGIVAARLRERHGRPTIVFARADDGLLRGSGRSVEGLHLRDTIDWVARAEPGLIERFGGHAMAAGLTLHPTKLARFRALFVDRVKQVLGSDPSAEDLWSDGELPPALLNLATAEALRLAAPWGKDFPEPVFDGEFTIGEARVVGERHLKFQARAGDGPPVEAIGFGLAEAHAQLGQRMHLVYRLDVNEYRGLRRPQLYLESLPSTI